MKKQINIKAKIYLKKIINNKHRKKIMNMNIFVNVAMNINILTKNKKIWIFQKIKTMYNKMNNSIHKN